jgi:hypothetical protein
MLIAPALGKWWSCYNLSGRQFGNMYQKLKFLGPTIHQFHFKDLIYPKEVIGQMSRMFVQRCSMQPYLQL